MQASAGDIRASVAIRKPATMEKTARCIICTNTAKNADGFQQLATTDITGLHDECCLDDEHPYYVLDPSTPTRCETLPAQTARTQTIHQAAFAAH